MKKIGLKNSSFIVAGDFSARLAKQSNKCMGGSSRACRRMFRMLARAIPSSNQKELKIKNIKMKKIILEKNIEIVAGDRSDRLLKQEFKCRMGSKRACRRAERIRRRMQLYFITTYFKLNADIFF